MKSIGLTHHMFDRTWQAFGESFFVSLIISIASFLKAQFLNSGFCSILTSITKYIYKKYTNSFLKFYISRDGIIQSTYETSFLCFLINSIFKLLCTIAGTILGLLRRIFKGSFVYETAVSLSQKAIFSYTSCMALFIGFMMICPHELWNNIYGVAAAFGFLAYFMAKCHEQKESADFKYEGFGLILFIMFSVLSVTYAVDKVDAVRIELFLIASVIFAFILKNAITDIKKLIIILKVISIAGFVCSLVAIFQRLTHIEVDPEFVDMANNSSMPGRVFSTFANPNNFAELLVLVMPITAALVFMIKSIKEKLLYAIIFTIDFVAIAMTYSRSCWIALVIAIFVMLVIYDWRLIVPIAVVALIAIPFLPESITDRIMTIGSMKDSSNAYRPKIWYGTRQMIENYFLSGVGPGPLTFTKYYRPFAVQRAITAPHSHMVYMELIIEFGFVAFIGFILYMIYAIKKSFHAVEAADKNIKIILAALIGSMFGMAFVFSVEYVWFYPRVMFMFWIMLGILFATIKLRKKGN